MSIADKLTTIAENEQKVYDAGKKSEYDKFWDATQQNGERTNYIRAFEGYIYNADNFYPKYDIRPVGDASNMFYNWSNGVLRNQNNLNLSERLRECGVVLDTSKATHLNNMFAYCHFTEIPAIDVTGLTVSANLIFSRTYSFLKKIEKVIVREETVFENCFIYAEGLEEIRFEGVIGQTGLNFQWTNVLSVESMKSIISCLKDYSGTETAGVNSIIFSGACWTALEADSSAPDGGTWKQYVAKLGWTT